MVKNMTNQELRDLISAAQAELKSRTTTDEQLAKPRTMASMFPAAERYNGGWAKLVRGIDRSKVNGFSILGDFIKIDEPHFWKNGQIVLDCDIKGSRKHPVKHYTLMQYFDGELHVIARAEDTKSWAVLLWDAIEAAREVEN